MNTSNTINKFIQFLCLSLLLFFSSSFMNTASASHVVGSDITYRCSTTPGIWIVTLTIYKDCNGIPLCSGGCGPCTTTIQLNGADASCNGTTIGSQTLSLISVSDVGINSLCPSSNSFCTNNGCKSVIGTYSPGVEKYVFEGQVDLRNVFPSTCCKVNLNWSTCCRNSAINTISNPGGTGFYCYAIIDRCAAANSPCNNSPELTNDPFAVLCGGQGFTFNNGAIDPDHDSLSYTFTPSLDGSIGASVNYQSPYAYDKPMPHYAPDGAPYPLGINCDPLSGDISFTPVNGSGNPVIGVMAVEIKQWRYDANGNPILVGVTRRDIQMWLITCPNNNSPRIMTNPPNPNIPSQPKTSWSVCVGNTLCFDVIAKDTDFYPTNSPPISDTTYLGWNLSLASRGATFLPKYNPANRHKSAALGGGPREDIYQFCWTPTANDAATLPWYFTVTAKDDRCPNAGRTTRAIAITVLPQPDVSIVHNDLKCGKWAVKYVKNKPSQTFQSVIWNISRVPNDYSGTNVNTYLNVQTPPVQNYTIGGLYLVELIVNIAGPTGQPPCSKSFYDTLLVDTTVVPFVRDTFVCIGGSVTIPFSAKWGHPSYFYRWFAPPDTFINPLNAPNFISNTFTVTTSVNKRLTLQVRDLNGCRGYDSNVLIVVKPLPVFTKPDSARICAGSSYTIDFGNNAGNVRNYLWNTGVPADTLRTLMRTDSNSFILQITDTFYCRNQDTFNLFVNSPILPNAGLDTAICRGDTATLRGSGGYLYQWRNLTTGAIIQAKSYNRIVRVNPTVSTSYELRAFLSYPDTTAKYLECSKTDTVLVTVNALPVLTRPQPVQSCKSTKILNLSSFGLNQTGGVGVWSYPSAPGGVIGGASPKVLTDSLKNTPFDSLNYNTGFNNWIRYKYTAPAIYGGCTNYDSAIVTVYGVPYVVAGFDVKWCKNAGVFKLQYDPSRPAPYGTSWIVTPTDGTGQIGVWTGNGVNTIISGSNSRYEFDPKKPGVLTSPQSNILTYKYTKQYSGSGAPSCIGQDTVLFEVTPVPTVIAGSLNPVCNNDAVFNISTLSGANTTSGASGFWTYAPISPLNGINLAMKDSQNFDPSKVTFSTGNSQGSWKLYYNDISTGCPVKDSLTITAAKYPIVSITFDANLKHALTICRKSGTTGLTATNNVPGGVGTYTSTPTTIAYSGSLLKSSFNTDDASVTETGSNPYKLIYNYVYTIPASTVQCKNADTALLTIEEPPVIDITTDGLAICAKDSVFNPLKLTISPSSYTYKWTHFGGGHWLNGVDNTSSLTYVRDSLTDVPAGTIKVMATTIKSNTCPIAKDSTTLTIYKQPVAGFICDNCEGCVPVFPVLTAKPAGPPVTYQWSIDGTINTKTDSIIKLGFPQYGTYVARLRVTTPTGGCTDISKPQNIYAHAIPIANFEPDPKTTTVARPFFSFNNQSTSADKASMTYLWNFGPEIVGGSDRTSTETNPKGIGYAADTSNRKVSLRVTTQFGCIDSINEYVRIDPDISVFIPNAFHPGSLTPCTSGDLDCNSKFKVAALGYMTIEIYIFNRWGQQVFYSNDANIGWNGNMNNVEAGGVPCQQDVYIYQVNATSFSGKAYKYSGSVTLLR